MFTDLVAKREFPLVQLPRKLKAEDIWPQPAEFLISISSTSEEVKRVGF